MKIKPTNQLGLAFTDQIKREFYAIQSKNVFDKLPDDYTKPFREQWKQILSDEGNKNLLFSTSAREIANKIRIDRFKPSILKVAGNKKFTFLIDDSRFYRVCLAENEIFALHVQKKTLGGGKIYLHYDSFKIKPLEDVVVYPPNQNDYLNDSHFCEFLKLLIFVEYSDIQEVLVKPNGSYGTRRKGKFRNETRHEFVIVDSAWNNIVVRTEGFGVSGHLRLQAIGKNREQRKLIYISEYYKNGYVRGAKKELLSVNP